MTTLSGPQLIQQQFGGELSTSKEAAVEIYVAKCSWCMKRRTHFPCQNLCDIGDRESASSEINLHSVCTFYPFKFSDYSNFVSFAIITSTIQFLFLKV